MPSLHTAGLMAAEAAVNAALKLSPHSLQALGGLAGQVLALDCTRPRLTLYLHSETDGTLRLCGVHEGPVDTRVIGSLEDFIELARAEDPAAALINGGVQLQGSSATLMAMQRVFADLEIDWEAPLVEGLGDVAGHQLALVLKGSVDWSRQAGASLRRQLGEFALEEARLSPPRLALEGFYSEVQGLLERSERLEQRIALARQRLDRLQDS